MSLFAQSVKSVAKVALQSRLGAVPRPCKEAAEEGAVLTILANGPSLTQSLTERADLIASSRLMTVNLAPLQPEIRALQPRWHVMADPYFFSPATIASDDRLQRLWQELKEMPSTGLLVPARAKLPQGMEPEARFNMIGAEGYAALTHPLFSAGLAMPRPRNVLVPAIMCGISLGFKTIHLLGADHSWTRTLNVDASNRTLNHQPHFYADSAAENKRVEAVQATIPIHAQLESFAIAFKAYHDIAAWAGKKGVRIINSTPGSFIDAFPRD